VDGPEKGLTILDGLHLQTYHAYQAATADLLRRAGQHTAAGAAYRRAIELTSNPAEKTFLRGQLDELTARTDHKQ
jgi:RNA polymerase sigma-70 factor (ECF subfamily)